MEGKGAALEGNRGTDLKPLGKTANSLLGYCMIP